MAIYNNSNRDIHCTVRGDADLGRTDTLCEIRVVVIIKLEFNYNLDQNILYSCDTINNILL